MKALYLCKRGKNLFSFAPKKKATSQESFNSVSRSKRRVNDFLRFGKKALILWVPMDTIGHSRMCGNRKPLFIVEIHGNQIKWGSQGEAGPYCRHSLHSDPSIHNDEGQIQIHSFILEHYTLPWTAEQLQSHGSLQESYYFKRFQ